MGAAPWDRKSVANQSSSIKSRLGWRPRPIPSGRWRPPACARFLPREGRKRRAIVTHAKTFLLPLRPERELLLNNAAGPAKQDSLAPGDSPCDVARKCAKCCRKRRKILFRRPRRADRGHRACCGCSPTARRARRKFMSGRQLRCNASTVARPVAMRPSRRRRSARQAKWRDHRWRRGLNRGTVRPVRGSRARVLAYLWPLHAGHAQASSAAVLPPPSARGRTCSQTNGAHEKVAGCPQYSQQSLARSRT